MKLSIGSKIGAGYTLAVMILVAIGVISYFSVQRFIQTAQQVEHYHQVVDQTGDIVVSMINIETGQRGYTITGRENFLEPYHTGQVSINTDLGNIHKLVEDDKLQQLLSTLEPLVKERVAFNRKLVDLQKGGQHAAVVQLIMTGQGKRQMDAIRKIVEDMKARQQVLLKQSSDASDANARSLMLVINLGIPFCIILLSLVGFLIVRDISQPLQKITGIADSIASGDLDVTVGATTRSDEIGVLSLAFARMLHALQTMAQAVGEVASGNLAVEVKPQSEKDVVGRALTTMVESLSQLVGQVQNRASR